MSDFKANPSDIYGANIFDPPKIALIQGYPIRSLCNPSSHGPRASASAHERLGGPGAWTQAGLRVGALTTGRTPAGSHRPATVPCGDGLGSVRGGRGRSQHGTQRAPPSRSPLARHPPPARQAGGGGAAGAAARSGGAAVRPPPRCSGRAHPRRAPSIVRVEPSRPARRRVPPGGASARPVTASAGLIRVRTLARAAAQTRSRADSAVSESRLPPSRPGPSPPPYDATLTATHWRVPARLGFRDEARGLVVVVVDHWRRGRRRRWW
jgi:hypothetical protein